MCSKYSFQIVSLIVKPKFQIFSKKTAAMVKIFKDLGKSELIVKVSKYSIKSEAVIRRCTTKNQFWAVLNISQIKILYMDLF